MSNVKSIVLLVFLAAAMMALLVFPFSSSTLVRSVSFSLADSTADYRRIEIMKSGCAPVVLERETSWRLTRPYAGKADCHVIARLLDQLMFTPVTDVISDSKMLKLGRSFADFSLTDPALRLSLFDRAGEVTEIAFGARTPTADGVYATILGQSAVYVIPTGVVALVEAPAADFRSRRLVTTSFDTVDAIDIKVGSAAPKSFVRTEEGWRSDEGMVAGRVVDHYVTEFLSTSLVDFVWPTTDSNNAERVTSSVLAGYGLDPESAVAVTIRQAGVKERVFFGKATEKDGVYAFVQEGGVIATVPAALKDKAEQASLLFLDSRLFPVDEKMVRTITICDRETIYSLTKGEEASWQLETPISAPADKDAVSALLQRMLTLTTADVCASNAPEAVAVSVSTNGVPTIVAKTRLMQGARYEDLRSRTVVSLETAQVRRLVRTLDAGRAGALSSAVSLAGDHGVWSVEAAGENAQPDEKAIAEILSALRSLTADRVEKIKVPAAELDDYGLGRPFLTLAVDLKDETAVRRNILIGKKTAGGRYLTIGSLDAVFVVSDALIEKLSLPLVQD